MIPLGQPSADPGARLDDEVAACGELLAALQREQAALLKADAHAVREAAASKASRVDVLRRLAQARVDALRRAGFAPGPDGMARWLAGNPPGLAERWAAITRATAEARTLNDVNGRLILTQQRHWDRALAALMRAAGVSATYGADGRTQHALPGRSIAAI